MFLDQMPFYIISIFIRGVWGEVESLYQKAPATTNRVIKINCPLHTPASPNKGEATSTKLKRSVH